MATTMTGATATACTRCHEWIESGEDGVWASEDGTDCADIEHEQLRHWVAMCCRHHR